jgi:hypothetical protein
MVSTKNRDSLLASDVIIPKDKAVFWLDANGFWRNKGGRFRHKKISDHFHAAIQKDAGGYFLFQDRGGITEKVYFPYEDTVLFVFEVNLNDNISLVLNTGEKVHLEPKNLFVQNDNLYLSMSGERVKFTERSLIKISQLLEVDDDNYYIRLNGKKNRIESAPPGS